MSGKLRRVAAHEVIADGRIYHQAVVEILDGCVTDYYTFTGEQPFTEWLGGEIHVVDTGGRRIALRNGEQII